jgi:hypothetical protein
VFENNTQDSSQSLSALKSVAEKSPDISRVTCIECGQIFEGHYARGNMVRHIKTMHGDTVYTCRVEDCGEVFLRSDYRLKHYRNKHPELNVASGRKRAP